MNFDGNSDGIERCLYPSLAFLSDDLHL